MQRSASDEAEWPFPGEHEETHHHVDDLEDGEGFHCVVEVFGQEIPENFRPEEAFKCSCALVCGELLVSVCLVPVRIEERTDGSCEHNETSPVVLDKFSHLRLKIFSSSILSSNVSLGPLFDQSSKAALFQSKNIQSQESKERIKGRTVEKVSK